MSLSSVAKTFLANILRIENSITSEQSDVCFICHERCGTLSPETGIMELEVRLPCNHTVGSGVSHPLTPHIMLCANAETSSASQLGLQITIHARYVVASFFHDILIFL